MKIQKPKRGGAKFRGLTCNYNNDLDHFQGWTTDLFKEEGGLWGVTRPPHKHTHSLVLITHFVFEGVICVNYRGAWLAHLTLFFLIQRHFSVGFKKAKLFSN